MPRIRRFRCGGGSTSRLRDPASPNVHRAVRPDITFILGGIHSPARLGDYRRAAPGRRVVVVKGMAYSLAQRRRLGTGRVGIARSARECFLLTSAECDRACAWVLRGAVA